MTLKVLAIDDDVAVTELLFFVLQSHGYEAFTANKGEVGIKIIREKMPDVIVLDLMMPGMDGFEVCHEVRKFSEVPIIILSALDDPDMVTKALDAGADDYLTKPVSNDVLVAHINNLTRRAQRKKDNGLIGSHTLATDPTPIT